MYIVLHCGSITEGEIMKSNAVSVSKSRTHFVVNCGLFIAIAIVLKLAFEIYIPLGGFPALRVSLTTLPIMLSGFLLGPAAGFVVGFITDTLAYIVKPAGPYFVGFTISSGLSGLIPGLIWKFLKHKNIKHLEWINPLFMISMIFALFGSGVFSFSNHTFYYGVNSINPFVFWIMFAMMIALAFFPLLYLKRHTALNLEMRSDYILFAVSVSQFINSIVLNTVFLTILYGMAISVLLPARIVSNIFLIPVYTVILTVLVKAGQRIKQ